jgi:long-subunit fatty acid transport protein
MRRVFLVFFASEFRGLRVRERRLRSGDQARTSTAATVLIAILPGVIAGALGRSGRALASGFEYPDNGTQAMGRGSAFAAKASDGTAIYYNPSGLAQQDGWRILIDGQAVMQSIQYQRTDAAGNNIGPPVSNSGGPFFAPFIAVSKQVIPGLTIAVGGYGPPANGNFAFPDVQPPTLTNDQKITFFSQCGLSVPTPQSGCAGADTSSTGTSAHPTGVAPQRFEIIDENLLVFYPSVSVGWAPPVIGRWIQLGGTLQLEYANSSFRQSTYDGALSEQSSQGGGSWTHQPSNELLTYDTIANVAVSGFTVSGIVGLTVTPIPSLRIGASYRPRTVLNQTGTLKLNYSPLAQGLNAQATGNGTSNGPDSSNGNAPSGQGPTSLSAVFPGELKSGLDWSFGFGDVELDFNYTQWSQYQESVLTPQYSLNTTVTGTNPIPPVYLIHDFQDAWALRLGADFDIPVPGIRLTLRAGGGYESNAYNENKTQFVTVNFANFDQIYGSVGATIGIAWFDLDLAYSHVYMPTDQVRNSGEQAVVNNPPAQAAPVIVGNGNYKSGYDLVAVGLRAHF